MSAQAHKIEDESEQAAKKFMQQMESRVAKAHDRLEARRRRRSMMADPSTKLFVLPEGVKLNDIGFKLKINGGQVVVYGMDFDSPAFRVGVRDGFLLVRAAGKPVDPAKVVSLLRTAPRPLKLVFKAPAKRKLKAVVHAAMI